MAITKTSKNSGDQAAGRQDIASGTQYELTDGTDAAAQPSDEPSMGWLLVRELVETVVLSLIIFLLIRQVVQNYRIESHSMEPNFYEGQFILVNKLAYRLGSAQRGDVIVFHNPNNPGEDYIKRVIALPGDTLEIRGQEMIINGEVQEEPYPLNDLLPNSYFGPEIIQPNHLFVMGDNRPNSRDSRVFGQLDEDLVVGKTWVRVFPLSAFGPIAHYDLQPSASAEQGLP
jgi:signal peptidase I